MTTDRKQTLAIMAIGLLLFLYGSWGSAPPGSWQHDWSFRGGVALFVVGVYRLWKERQRTRAGQS